MHFDPAIAAQQALHRAAEEGELADLEQQVADAEDTFSSSTGAEAAEAFARLQDLGERLPEARAFQEFLIYAAWQQVAEDPLPGHFQRGAALCDRFLRRFGSELHGTETLHRVTAIRRSFTGGLGAEPDGVPEYDEDAFSGGD